MKRYLSIFLLLFGLHVSGGWAIERGIPFFKSFTAAEYGAHNQNLDVVCDDHGNVFVANFEGLLYYDHSSWRKILTPGVSRVTRVANDRKGRIWIGGYNVFGYLKADKQGRLQMKLLMSDLKNSNNVEIDGIKIISNKRSDNSVYCHTTQGRTYRLDKNEKMVLVKNDDAPVFSNLKDSVNSIVLPDKVRISYNNTSGICFSMPDGSKTFLTDADGIPANDVNFLSYDQKNTVWAATTKGLFCLEVSTPYSHITENEGLKGAVNCLGEINNSIYIGTVNGLYKLHNGQLTSFDEIYLSCWNLIKINSNQLLASTSQGLFLVSANGVRKITGNNTYVACLDPQSGNYITGENDGIYRVSPSGKRTKICNIGKVYYITWHKDYLELETIYESIWKLSDYNSAKPKAVCTRKEPDPKEPLIDYTDAFGRTWLSDNSGTNLYVKGAKDSKKLSLWLHPLRNKALKSFLVCDDGNIIAGGDFGLIILDNSAMNAIPIIKLPKPYFREFVAIDDSVVFGGFEPGGMEPMTSFKEVSLPSSCTYVKVSFSLPYGTLVAPTMYRYRVNDGKWSPWSTDAFVEFKNLTYGTVNLDVQARDAFGRESEVSSIQWYVEFPWYLQWWALLFYLIALIYLVSMGFRWRERKLQRDKEKLEGVVAERTAELSKSYEEQQKISSELSVTLDDLKKTQNDLIRMERTATAGKLTQGLIDRILNPINYINNFSKLTKGLAHDIKEDIEDEEENMSKDNFEDCEDILDMMDKNLSKIEEHGVNTTRTLRAMEAMLNNHVGALVSQDIRPLCSQVVKVTADHFKEDIARCGISLHADLPDSPVMVAIDADSMNRVLLSLLSNSVYAVVKKFGQSPYNNPDVFLSVKVDGEHVIITTHDNGIGIEDTIKEKVFDPFFTTKTTGEAAGVGLYLVREIVNDHKGTITLNSEKGEFCEFVIRI